MRSASDQVHGEPTLSAFLWTHPALSLFDHVAWRNYGESRSRHERFAMLRRRTPRYYTFCLIVDTTLTVVSALLLLAAGALVLYKTVWLPLTT
jgi:hypothetical protein